MREYKRVTSCRVCGSTRLKEYLNLGNMPLPNKLAHSPSDKLATYPLEVMFCEDCALSQLSVVVRPELMFSNYTYQSSISATFKKHCNDMAVEIKKLVQYEGKTPIVTDIASNDGCLLDEFRANGFVVHGIEPSQNLVDISRTKLISTVCEYWSEDFSKEYRKMTNRNNDVFTATNVLAHVDNVRGFIRAMKGYSKGQIVVVEVPHLLNLMKHNQFDTIYHEHLSYFLLKPLKILFESCGLTVFKVSQHPIHGGSIRVYASEEKRTVDESVDNLLNEERMFGMYEINTYENYVERVNLVKKSLLTTLGRVVSGGKKVMAYGASAKGSILLNYCGIDSGLVDYVVDDTPSKWGKYVPGAMIPIVPFEYFEREKPDYILLTAWNFAEEMMAKTKHVGAKYIVPIPEVVII